MSVGGFLLANENAITGLPAFLAYGVPHRCILHPAPYTLHPDQIAIWKPYDRDVARCLVRKAVRCSEKSGDAARCLVCKAVSAQVKQMVLILLRMRSTRNTLPATQRQTLVSGALGSLDETEKVEVGGT